MSFLSTNIKRLSPEQRKILANRLHVPASTVDDWMNEKELPGPKLAMLALHTAEEILDE